VCNVLLSGSKTVLYITKDIMQYDRHKLRMAQTVVGEEILNIAQPSAQAILNSLPAIILQASINLSEEEV
jgi:hypothetical protein